MELVRCNIDLPQDQWPVIKAKITTDHALSSYGQPVIILDDKDGSILEFNTFVALGYALKYASPDEQMLLEKWIELGLKTASR